MVDHESYRRYAAERHRQLRAENSAFWVYRHDANGCEGRHEDLDGLALPPDHPFWQRHYPPLDDECGCYVVGASSPRGVLRIGGDPAKTVPDWVEIAKPSLWSRMRRPG